ncbi:hypothetical protein KOR42_22650 [Thalassoglobus neptunius]|uniref:Uncharacterized protein n=1 Tax=Thalassoglobus neptunius TaxID=1938619 RepID=A0A5C5X7V4_9PLAN|nr:hypothetical protein [Thalassoglobus neptunius]TWT58878.1 hypothetical protein KOR42_22650 [Thalassoglobus neptunius]
MFHAVCHSPANDSSSFDNLDKAATRLSQATILPQKFQGEDNIGNCVLALMVADRYGIDVLTAIHQMANAPGGVIADCQVFQIYLFNQCGRFTPIRYIWTGTEGMMNYGVRAESIELATGQAVTGPVFTVQDALDTEYMAVSISDNNEIPYAEMTQFVGSQLVQKYAPDIAGGLTLS